MTDFFTRLAERTLGLAAIIEPVIAPMYAPETYQVDAELVEEEQQETQGTVPPAPPFPLAERERALAPAPVSPALPPRELSAANGALLPSLAGPDAIESVERSQAESFAAESRRERRGRAVAESEEDLVVQQKRAGTEERKPIQQESPPPSHERRERQPIFQLEEHVRHEQQESTAPVSAPHYTPTIDTFPAEAQQRVQVRAIQVARLSQRAQQEHVPSVAISAKAAQDATSVAPAAVEREAATTVQVTIGRIEVRASATMPKGHQPQRPASVPAAISLNDYLHQRERGGHA